MVGIPLILASAPVALLTGSWYSVLMLCMGWFLQFIGHAYFEENKPAFFTDPYALGYGVRFILEEYVLLFSNR